jgi:hypothetical protein
MLEYAKANVQDNWFPASLLRPDVKALAKAKALIPGMVDGRATHHTPEVAGEYDWPLYDN